MFQHGNSLRCLVVSLAVAIAFTSQTLPVAAFDTGPHASMTINALLSAGFNESAADAVQVENWLTDYYTSSPTIGKAAQCDLEKLHFDDVFSSDKIATYWSTLAANTKLAVTHAQDNNDIVAFYVALGVSLHVVQDFYAHSNWVEASGIRPEKYSTTTWVQSPNASTPIYTGWYANCLNLPRGSHVAHGSYTWGMNHDSVVRPNFDRAYVYGYAASYEWTRNVLDWIDPSFKAKVITFNPSDASAKALAYDQAASLYISEWIDNPEKKATLDGHWNGNRSGYAAAVAAFAARWTAARDSIFVAKFKETKTYALLSKGLYNAPPALASPLKVYPTSGTIFAMRTMNVYANSALTNTDSYYGELVRLSQGRSSYPYRDAAQHHRPRSSVPWLQLIFVPLGQSTIDLAYTLWNEWFTTNNDRVPIKGNETTLHFTCVTNTASCKGDISGGPWSSSSPFRTSGNGTSGVKLELYFTTTPALP